MSYFVQQHEFDNVILPSNLKYVCESLKHLLVSAKLQTFEVRRLHTKHLKTHVYVNVLLGL